MSEAGFLKGTASARFALLALTVLLFTGCDQFPKDSEGTLERIRTERVLRVGIEQSVPTEAHELLQQVEEATGARVRLSRGRVEPLLRQLEAGEIDLILAQFSKKTPWETTVALSPPLRIEGRGKHAAEWRAAMRNGENRWIMLVETRARRVSSAPDAS